MENKICWKMRLTMARNIAEAIRFLHSFQPKIIHRDLKTPNCLVNYLILLVYLLLFLFIFYYRLFLLFKIGVGVEELIEIKMANTDPSADIIVKVTDFGESRAVATSYSGRDRLQNPS